MVRRVAAAVLVAIGLAVPARAAQSFVYVAVAAPPCTAIPCLPGQLVVFDSLTQQIVTAAPLGNALDVPQGMAIAPDGRRLYISMLSADGSASLVVFDTTLHRMLSTHPISPAAAGSIAVSRDSRRVFIGGTNPCCTTHSLVVWDTQSSSVTNVQQGTYHYLFAHPAFTQVVGGTVTRGGGASLLQWSALDEVTGAVLASTSGLAVSLSLSPDGSRLYNVARSVNPSVAGTVLVVNPMTLEPMGTVPCVGCFPEHAVDAPDRNRVYVLTRLSDGARVIQASDRTTGAVLGTLPLDRLIDFTAVSGDERGLWMASPSRPPQGSSPALSPLLSVVNLDSFTTAQTIPLPASALALAVTPPGPAPCSYSVNPRQISVSRQGGTATVTLSTSCDWMAGPTASWLHVPSDAGAGTGGRTIEVTIDPFFGSEASRSATLTIAGQVVTFTQAGVGSAPAFGSFDTPVDGATGITGSMAVSGWALDDVGVVRVRIFRDGSTPAEQVYIGDATLVDGARPDVAAVFPSLPFASRAGWGYLLLTNVLPGGGTGTYRLHAFADDIEGHTTLIGSRTISCANSTATVPFGAIDTPGQGEVVSGLIVNWGWALSRQSAIAADGSTIDVLIDDVVVGHPTYGQNRPDVAALFPGYENTNGAGGYFMVDTTLLSDGVHTISWLVRDGAANVSGIGSRYFTVANGS